MKIYIAIFEEISLLLEVACQKSQPNLLSQPEPLIVILDEVALIWAESEFLSSDDKKITAW